VRTTDGTQYLFYPSGGNGNYHCTQIKDRNGNFITINYNGLGRPSTVIDTLGRTVNFNYDLQNYLASISQTWNGQTHNWAQFSYDLVTMQTYFPNLYVVGAANGTTIPVLKQVTFADNSKYTFDYTSYGQINRFNTYAPDGHLLAYTSYNMQTGGTLADCPRFSERRDWAQNRNFVGGVASEAVTAYTVDPSGSNGWTQITYPDNTKHKEIFATSGWQTGLTTRTEEYDAANTMQKWTTTTWTQDNLYAGYQINPRPTDADIYDASGNHKHTHIEYTAYASFTLPNDVTEYDSNGTTPLRRTHTDYRWDQGFLDHYVIGLPAIKYVYDGGGGLLSKLEYHYDWAAPYMISQGTPVQHDEANYGSSFIFGRGNLTGVGRWNVLAPNDQSQAIYVSLLRYNTNGSVYFTEDAAGHQTNINYANQG